MEQLSFVFEDEVPQADDAQEKLQLKFSFVQDQFPDMNELVFGKWFNRWRA